MSNKRGDDDLFINTGKINNSFNETFNLNPPAKPKRLETPAALIGIIVGIIGILTFFGITKFDDIKSLLYSQESNTKTVSFMIEGTWTDGKDTWIFSGGRISINGRSQAQYTITDNNHILLYEGGVTIACQFTITPSELNICIDKPNFLNMPLARVSDNTITTPGP